MNEAAKIGGREGGAFLGVSLDPERFPRKVLFTCFGIELLLYLLDYHLNYGRAVDIGAFRRIFTATIETSLPSFFSVVQTAFSALTLWLIVCLERVRRSHLGVVLGWAVLAAFFTYMAMDDGAKIHERMGTALADLREDAGEAVDFPSYHWQYFLMPFFGAMGLFLLVFLWSQLRDGLSRIGVVVALGMLSVAVAIDFVEGLDEEHSWNVYSRVGDRENIDAWADERFDRSGYEAVQHFAKAAEELIFEAGANSILWFLFLRHLLRLPGRELRLALSPRGPPAGA